MLVVETIAKIRGFFFAQDKAIKAICRELGVSWKVVRKVIRSGATEFRYEGEDQALPSAPAAAIRCRCSTPPPVRSPPLRSPSPPVTPC
jgi:hypothetical protein